MSAIAGGTQTSMLKEKLKGCMAREERVTCWTWHMDELHPSTGQRATPYSGFALETTPAWLELVLCSWKAYPKLVQRTEKTVTTSGRKKKKSSHCALLVKINSHAALLHILPKLRRRQNTNNAGISIYSFMILCMFSELRMWPLSRNQVMSNLWDYGVVEYQQCKNW